MCTATWIVREHGYDLFFNRDERVTRLPAEPPQMRERSTRRFIAPLDADAGGTWIAVNQHGLSLCLLNYYNYNERFADRAERHFTSRGLLVSRLIDSVDGHTVRQRLKRLNMREYRPFTLLTMLPGQEPFACRWDGSSGPDVSICRPPLSSSSFETEAVIRSRGALFEQWASQGHPLDTSALESYHRTHRPEKGPYSVCMHRRDARSVSLSYVAVRRGVVRFRYADGSPCTTDFSEPIELTRSAGNSD